MKQNKDHVQKVCVCVFVCVCKYVYKTSQMTQYILTLGVLITLKSDIMKLL